MASLVHVSQAATGNVNTLTQAGAPGVVWNLTALEISFAGPGFGANGKVTVYDGTVAGTALFAEFLTSPVGSVGTVQKINIPVDGSGRPALQGTPGNAMTIAVTGFGANACIINARFGDGIPTP